MKQQNNNSTLPDSQTIAILLPTHARMAANSLKFNIRHLLPTHGRMAANLTWRLHAARYGMLYVRIARIYMFRVLYL